jgi:hypothetical protein
MSIKISLGVLLALSLSAIAAAAQPGQGPVASACNDDIAKLSNGKSHENREARTCLEANKAKVSAACKTALETTGGGQGKGMSKKN